MSFNCILLALPLLTPQQLHKNTHTILGTVVVAALLLQPFLGYIHHRRYQSISNRTAWTYIHVWYGRMLIILGIINGGLGLHRHQVPLLTANQALLYIPSLLGSRALDFFH